MPESTELLEQLQQSDVLFQRLGVAMLLGLLVGLQREHTANTIAGLRTFSLITVLGAICALLDVHADLHGGVLAAGLIGVALLVGVSSYLEQQQQQDGEADWGITTEVTVLLMYGLGAYVIIGNQNVAVAIGVGVAILLHFKSQLHYVAGRLGDEDLRAILQFALITFIILPILPNETFDPYQVINPREVWLMVVLIVGVGLGGYIAYKFFGERAGTLVGGILGGVISSTAATFSYSRRSAAAPDTSRLCALVIVIASTVVYVRVLVEISVISRTLLAVAAAPILITALAGAVTVPVLLWRGGTR
ncbi:MAG: DUF4010 domain-containing protein, partial [Planctomycetales bacterium]